MQWAHNGLLFAPLLYNICLHVKVENNGIVAGGDFVNRLFPTRYKFNALSSAKVFQFKFELNKPVIYAVEKKSRTVSDVTGDGRSSLTRNSEDGRYKIRLTAINTNSNGTTTVFYEPFDFEQDADIVGPAGQVNQTTKGLDIVVKQNGIVTIDTANNIGMAQVLPIYLTSQKLPNWRRKVF